MRARDERIIIVGDSLSHPGADSSPTTQAITHGSNRASSAPGDLLGSLLLEQGAKAVRINAKVGRSAVSFFGSEPANQLIADDRSFAPTKVIVMLGTNDVERDLAKTEQAMAQLRDVYRGMGAEVWAIGPMTYVGRGATLNPNATAVLATMQRVFGKTKTIDARQMSAGADRASDGIHFTQMGARYLAPQLAKALLSTSPFPLVARNLAIGFIGALAIGLLAWAVARRHQASVLHGQKRVVRGLEAMRISTKIPAEMTASQINKELDRIDVESSKINEKLIAAGRGSETYNETYKKNDPLAQEFRALHDRRSALRIEIHLRMGPGHPSRIPSERFWASPRKKPGVEGLGFNMLQTIARESKSPEEFALRAEAWAAGESKPPNDKELALAYYRACGACARIGAVMQLVRKARQKRQANTKARFQALIKQPAEAIDGLGITKLWRYAMPAGLWRIVKADIPNDDDAKRWLEIFEKDEPGVAFKVSKVKPSKDPKINNRFDGLARPTLQQVAEEIRQGVQAQVDTTDSGKLLTACNPPAMKNLVKNIVGNVGMAVDLMLDEAIEEEREVR